MKLYLNRVRQDNGTWIVDPEPRTKKEAKRLAQEHRVLFGIITSIWPEEEARVALSDEFQKP